MDLTFGIVSFGFVLLLAYFLGIFRGAPWVPTGSETAKRMIEAARIKPGDKVADLGAGDGRLLIAAAQAGAIAHGFEINPLLVWWASHNIRKAGLNGRAFIHWKNFWLVNFADYQVVMLFGITGIMPALEKKLKAELAPGSRVVSNLFKFPTWESEKVENVYVYRVGKISVNLVK